MQLFLKFNFGIIKYFFLFMIKTQVKLIHDACLKLYDDTLNGNKNAINQNQTDRNNAEGKLKLEKGNCRR